MQSWAAQELQTAALGDPRRGRRLVTLVEALAAQPAASVPRACGSWAATKGAYRFWNNPHITADAIRAAHIDATRQRLRALPCILAVQDTTTLDWSHHPGATGLGPLNASGRQGMHVHSTLAVTTDGVPLGLLDQQVWTRDPTTTGRRHTRRQRPTAAKESQRWLDALRASMQLLPEDRTIVTIADREADIYDVFAQERRSGAALLIRAAHNRKVTHAERYLWDAVWAAPVQSRRTLAVGRTPLREPREAQLEVRWVALEMLPPRHQVRRTHRDPVPVVALLVTEVNAPEDVPPLCWLLLTTLAVADAATAWELVHWYSYRWLIERYHYVLKSGCQVEQLQLESRPQLERALATYCIVAWRLLWLTYEARARPDQPCTVALDDDEWQALAVARTNRAAPPAEPPRLCEAVRWIAQLGGFLARTGDGEPGVKTLWQGMQRLHDLTLMWRLTRSPPPFA